MSRSEIKGTTPRDIYNINDNFIQLSQQALGSADFTKKLEKKIEGILTKVGGIEGNYSTKTQTAEAIAQAVMGQFDQSVLLNYSTLTQTADAIASAVVNLADKAEVELVSTSLIAKFSSSGAKNLLMNSGFQDGINNWYLSGGSIALGDSPSSPSGKRLRLSGSLNTTQLATQTISKGFDPNNKKWNLSALMMNTHVTQGTTNPYVDIQLTITYADASKEYFQLTGNDLSIYSWVKKSAIITSNATKTIASFTVGIYARDVTENYLDVGYVRLEEGEVSHSWSNADNEAYETSFKLSPLGFEMKDVNGNVLIEVSKGIANEQNFGSTQNVESGYPLNMSFRIGDTTSSITKVELKLKQYPFRTDSKGAKSGGGSTSGASSKSTSDNATPGSAGIFTEPPYGGVADDTHEHYIVPSNLTHNHPMAHVHSTPAHAHEVDFGILETPNTNGTIDVYIDGVYRVQTILTDTTLDITTWVTTNGSHSLSLVSPNMKRIQADVFIKSYIRR